MEMNSEFSRQMYRFSNRVADEFINVYKQYGPLDSLKTFNKNSLAEALNEVFDNNKATQKQLDELINDENLAQKDHVYSSWKTEQRLAEDLYIFRVYCRDRFTWNHHQSEEGNFSFITNKDNMAFLKMLDKNLQTRAQVNVTGDKTGYLKSSQSVKDTVTDHGSELWMDTLGIHGLQTSEEVTNKLTINKSSFELSKQDEDESLSLNLKRGVDNTLGSVTLYQNHDTHTTTKEVINETGHTSYHDKDGRTSTFKNTRNTSGFTKKDDIQTTFLGIRETEDDNLEVASVFKSNKELNKAIISLDEKGIKGIQVNSEVSNAFTMTPDLYELSKFTEDEDATFNIKKEDKFSVNFSYKQASTDISYVTKIDNFGSLTTYTNAPVTSAIEVNTEYIGIHKQDADENLSAGISYDETERLHFSAEYRDTEQDISTDLVVDEAGISGTRKHEQNLDTFTVSEDESSFIKTNDTYRSALRIYKREDNSYEQKFNTKAINGSKVTLDIRNIEGFTLSHKEDGITTKVLGNKDWVGFTKENEQYQSASAINLSEESLNIHTAIKNKDTSDVSMLFVEPTGSGSKYESTTENVWSFAGTNNGEANIWAQIYAVDIDTHIGSRISVNTKGAYYTAGQNNPSFTDKDEIATVGNVEDLREECSDLYVLKRIVTGDVDSNILNKADGGGAFIKTPEIWAYQGVTLGTNSNIWTESYTVDSKTGEGTRVITNLKGAYYTKNQSDGSFGPEDEIATIKDCNNLSERIDELRTDVDNLPLDSYVIKSLQNESGVWAQVINAIEGGGIKLDTNTHEAWIGVNDGTQNNIWAEICTINHETKIGSRILANTEGMFYTKDKDNIEYASDDEILTKGTLKNTIEEKVGPLGPNSLFGALKIVDPYLVLDALVNPEEAAPFIDENGILSVDLMEQI